MKKNILILFAVLFTAPFSISAQTPKKVYPRKNWQLSSKETDGLYGVEWDKAWQLIGKTPFTPIIVAVLDAGADINHPVLKQTIYKNTKEISGNGIDDDLNGYIDDINGWNFLGSDKGDLSFNNLEADREYFRVISTMDTANLIGKDLAYFNLLKQNSALAKKQQSIYVTQRIEKSIDSIEQMLQEMYKGKPLIAGFLKNLPLQNTNDMFLNTAANIMLTRQKLMRLDDSASVYKLLVMGNNLSMRAKEDYEKYLMLNLQDFRSKKAIPDTGHLYGNNHISLPSADHGTHVAGIIAGAGGELIGMNGAVQIIPIRAVPQGDEYDLDIANGIIYAVNNGAKIINMSFGKYFSPQKILVDSAIQYAQKKGVLLILAAGNDAKNTDLIERFPSQYFTDGELASNVLIVGASDSLGRSAKFSNYGKKNVDLFAPGVDIYSSLVNNKFAYQNGTSMAAPVASRVAAFLLSRFPLIKPEEMIFILKSTVTKPTGKLGSELEGLCDSGGIINAYKAAIQILKNRKIAN